MEEDYIMNVVWITSAEYLHDYMVRVTFNDGLCRDIDLYGYILQRQELFGELIDKEKFKNFKLNGWTLSWLGGKLDIAPESLYGKSHDSFVRQKGNRMQLA